MEPAEELEAWLETVSEKVRRNVEIVTPETLGKNTFLHISTDTAIKKFIPHIGFRQAKMEDRTVPRITVANSLLGCFIGYSASFHDFSKLASTGKKEDGSYKGGFIIYALPFKAALRPTPKMVYDAKMSGEHWLVSYSAESTEYKPTAVGKVFYRSVSMIARSGLQPHAEAEMFVEVSTPEGIQFSKNIMLTKGYWVIDGPMDYRVANWGSDKAFRVREIDKAEYLSNKMASANMLSYGEPPAFLGKW